MTDEEYLIEICHDLEMKAMCIGGVVDEWSTRHAAEYRAKAQAVRNLLAQLAAQAPVVEAAEKVRRGCDCDYDYRCGYCANVVNLQVALAALRANRDRGGGE